MQAERRAPLELAARDRLDRPAQDLGLIGGGVDGEGEDRAVERLAEEPPQPDILPEQAELAEAVIDQEELAEQRRAAEEGGVAVDRALRPFRPVEPGDAPAPTASTNPIATEIATSWKVIHRPANMRQP